MRHRAAELLRRWADRLDTVRAPAVVVETVHIHDLDVRPSLAPNAEEFMRSLARSFPPSRLRY